MLADGLRQLLERATAIEPTESEQSVYSTLLRLAWEVEADHAEARVYHEEIERLHRDVHATVTAMRGEWERMTRQPSPDERQVASEQIAACRAEVATLRQEIARYRGLLVASLARVQRNCRRIRALSVEHALAAGGWGAILAGADVEVQRGALAAPYVALGKPALGGTE